MLCLPLLFCLSPFSATLSGARAPEGAFAPICTRSGGPEFIFGEVREVLSTLESESAREQSQEGGTGGGEGWERGGGGGVQPPPVRHPSLDIPVLDETRVIGAL